VKNSVYEEFKRVLDKFPKFVMKILLWDIFKPKHTNDSLQEIINDNAVIAVTFKNITVKSTMFHIVTFINLLGHLIERLIIKLTTF
jgi:hypothetical protein